PSKEVATTASPRAKHSKQEGKELSRDFVEPSLEDWKNQAPEVREKYYKQTYVDFFAMINSYREDANSATRLSLEALKSSRRWQLGLTIATGLMTMINGFVALKLHPEWGWVLAALATAMPAVAVVYAGCLTIAQNIERSLKKADEASTLRDQREL